MTKYYTVTGKSTVRPANLPDGLEVEETDDGVFEREISCEYGGDEFKAALCGRSDSELRVALVDGVELASLYFRRSAVVKLRDALTEFLGDEPAKPTAPTVVNLGDPEPPRDAVYVEQDGSEWGHGSRGWDYGPYDGFQGRFSWDEVQGRWGETFPWTLKTD